MRVRIMSGIADSAEDMLDNLCSIRSHALPRVLALRLGRRLLWRALLSPTSAESGIATWPIGGSQSEERRREVDRARSYVVEDAVRSASERTRLAYGPDGARWPVAACASDAGAGGRTERTLCTGDRRHERSERQGAACHPSSARSATNGAGEPIARCSCGVIVTATMYYSCSNPRCPIFPRLTLSCG